MDVCSTSNPVNPHSPHRTIPKLRLLTLISNDDVSNEVCQLSDNRILIEGKNYTKSIFDDIITPNTTQEEIRESIVRSSVNSLLTGNDTTIVSFGSKSNAKDERLYGDVETRNGIVQMAINELMNNMDINRMEQRAQIRMSALMVSQKDNDIIDLLSPFNPDPRHRPVRFIDDPRSGTFVDNPSEIRLDSIDQALFYLNTAVDHRLIQDEHDHRTSHVLISLSLYSYKITDQNMEGGRCQLNFLDMGIGERNSSNGGLTMPALGAILLALIQRNKHIPSRETNTCQLLRCVLQPARQTSFMFSFGNKSDDNDNVAHLVCKIARTRMRNGSVGFSKKNTPADTIGGSSDSTKQLESGSEMSSAAETVIFLGPSTSAPQSNQSTPVRFLHRTTRTNSDLSQPLSIDIKTSPTHSCHNNCTQSVAPMLKGHTPFLSESLKLYGELCSPPGTSSACSPTAFGGHTQENREDYGVVIAPMATTSAGSSTVSGKSKQRYNLDDGKRKQILDWIESSEGPPVLFSSPVYEPSKDDPRECVGILSHPLEDIIEQDEESMRTSTATNPKKDDHPLRILSKQNLDEKQSEKEEGVAELELVMAASLSSMKSHDILAKLEAMRNTNTSGAIGESATTYEDGESEMNFYRRASHLEEYAQQRVKEIEESKLKKKKLKLSGLNCCQQSMVSSGSTVVDWSQVEKIKEQEKRAMEEEKRKELLRERRAKLKITELVLRKERDAIDKELENKKSIASSIARQLHHFSLSPCRGGTRASLLTRSSSTHRIDPPIASLPSTPVMSSRKSTSQKSPWTSISQSSTHQSLPRHTKLSNASRKTSTERKSSKASRSSERTRERRNSGGSRDRKSSEEMLYRSPYAHMTAPKTHIGPCTSSSGRGSSGPGSDLDGTVFSAHYNANESGIGMRDESRRSKRQSYSASSGYESAGNDYHIYTKQSLFDKKMTTDDRANFSRQSDQIRQRQRQLKKELEEAKRAIGQFEDASSLGVSDQHRLNGLNRTTLIDTLLQENRILEKRLIACRNHSMLVTAFI